MTSVTKDFVAKIAIGIEGYALLEIEETLSPHSVYKGNDIHPALIVDDIQACCIQEWVEYNLSDIPNEPGVYTARGSARFDEDSADYSVTFDEV